jgi:hypothetical protein
MTLRRRGNLLLPHPADDLRVSATGQVHPSPPSPYVELPLVLAPEAAEPNAYVPLPLGHKPAACHYRRVRGDHPE